MKKNSWHYKLAKIANQDHNIYDDEMSICQYTRKVFFGGMLFTFIMTLLSIMIWFLVMATYEIIGAIFGFASLGPAATILLGASLVIVLLVCFFHCKDLWDNKSKQLLKKNNNSFTSKVYKSYKDKICFSVKFEE